MYMYIRTYTSATFISAIPRLQFSRALCERNELKEELENKGEQFTIKNLLRNTKSLLLQYLGRTGLNKRV